MVNNPDKQPEKQMRIDRIIPKWRRYVVGMGAAYILLIFAGRGMYAWMAVHTPWTLPIITFMGAVGVLGTAYVMYEKNKAEQAKRAEKEAASKLGKNSGDIDRAS